MNTKPDKAPDQVIYLKGAWWCLVNNHLYGCWDNKGAAEAGLATEQRRALEPRSEKKS